MELQNIRQRHNENLRDFGLRVLKLTRDSMLPGAPEDIVEDQAIKYFLQSIDDPNEYGSLTMADDELSYHQLLNKAVKLRTRKEGHRRPTGIAYYAPPQQHRFRPQTNYTPMNYRNNIPQAFTNQQIRNSTSALVCQNCGKKWSLDSELHRAQ
jgi:hypothetical protein